MRKWFKNLNKDNILLKSTEMLFIGTKVIGDGK